MEARKGTTPTWGPHPSPLGGFGLGTELIQRRIPNTSSSSEPLLCWSLQTSVVERGVTRMLMLGTELEAEAGLQACSRGRSGSHQSPLRKG